MRQARRRAAGGPGQSLAARPRDAARPDVEQVLRLQRTAGNRATTAMIQRFGWGDAWDIVKGPVWRIGDLGDVVLGPLGGDVLSGMGADALFDQVVASNRRDATKFDVPASYVTDVKDYAAAAPEDGKVLLAALERKPRFYVGGWILDIQTGAEAMTLNRDVFCVKAPSVDTFVHELVHVKQYGDVGPLRFLTNYFGQVGWEALKALVLREEMDPFSASSYEKAGYALEERFKTWRKNRPR